jgi:hypothetical protein
MTEIGSTLREARMHARIDISEVEAHTKIRAKYLRAIENEEWDLLPGPVYVKSFLRTYGEYLGLDTRLLVDEFKRRHERPDQGPIASVGRERERPRDVRAGGRGGSGRGGGGRGGGPRTGGRRSGGRPPASRQSSGGRAGAIGAILFSPKALIGVVLVAIVVALYLIGSHGGGKSPSNDAANNTPPPSTQHHHPGTHTNTTPTTTTPKKPPVPTNATLKLVPTGTVWVCVENGNGKPLIDGQIFAAGDSVPTITSKQLSVTLGNAEAQVTTNGKSYPITASTAAIAFKVTPTGVSKLTSGPTCGQ